MKGWMIFLGVAACAAGFLAGGGHAWATDDVPAVGVPRVLDLDTAHRIALEGNPSLKAAEARVRQARQRVWQARSAWWPQLDISGSAAKTWLSERDYSAARDAASDAVWGPWYQQTQSAFAQQAQASVQTLSSAIISFPNNSGLLLNSLATRVGFFSGVAQSVGQSVYPAAEARRSIDDSIDDYRLSLTASWLLFNGFERKFLAAQAKFGQKETEAGLMEAERLLMSGVAQTFYAAQLARENIAISEADGAFNQRQLKEAKARRRVGAGSLSDELNFEILANAAKASLISSRRDYRTALIALAELLALPDALPGDLELALLPDETPELMTQPDQAEKLAYAKGHRPEMAMGRHAIDRTRAGVGASRAPFYPTVAAQASKDAARSDGYDFRADDFGTTIGVNVSYSLFTGGRNLAGYREARAIQSEAEHNLDQTQLAVASGVNQTLEELKASQEQLILQRSNAQNVQRNRELVEKEYGAGAASLVRLNQAQRDLIQAQGSLALARVSLLLAWHNVKTETAEILAEYATD
ncbi:MAG: TolC family protein [bacterium]|nr:TolC family protein [bacterium]